MALQFPLNVNATVNNELVLRVCSILNSGKISSAEKVTLKSYKIAENILKSYEINQSNSMSF